MPIEHMVVVHFDENGDQSYLVAGDERVRLYIIDERAPNDRVYEWLPRCDGAAIKALFRDGEPIGSSQDERHNAVAHAINAYAEGRPRLTVVPDPCPA